MVMLFHQYAENPILGVGIGNWKLYSIKYEAKNMYSYVVPFFAHNDFLEILAEIGIIGSVFFILFFIKMIQYNFIIISNWLNSNLAKSSNFIVVILLLIYLIDSNLNFPFGKTNYASAASNVPSHSFIFN